MIKLNKILLVSILLFYFISPVRVFASFSKYINNPVISLGSSGDWDSVVVSSTTTLFEGNQFKMWYSGSNSALNGKIGFANSLDGYVWTKAPNPVLGKDPLDVSELEVVEPSVLKINNEYKMWYLSTEAHTGPGDETYRIKYATSNDGINWTRHGYALRRRAGVGWESEGVSNPTVIYNGIEYKMFYSARDSGGIGRIGYASSVDGVNWTRLNNPVLIANLPWEGNSVNAASVIFDGDKYHLYYHAGPNVPFYFGHAVSVDGIDWIKDNNFILDRGGFNNWDQNLIAAPDVLRVHNKLKLYYSGRDTAFKWRIGLAEEKLPVPYFSQKDPRWGNDQYDSMNKNMSQVGCAVTSAAMVLRHFDVKKTPGNSSTGLPAKELTPGTLNEWLKDTGDGSFRNGATNFVSISAMTKKSHELDPTSPNLEYISDFNLNSIDSELTNDRAPILKLEYPSSSSNMHFVVATGSASGTYNILDPYYADRTTLSPHYPTVLRVDKFIPANSDFSYIVAAVDENVSLSLKDANGNAVGEVTVEKPLEDLVNQTTSVTSPLSVLYYAKPTNGTYTLEVNTPTTQTYQLDLYLYDELGDKAVSSYEGLISQGNNDTLNILFDKENMETSNITPSVTFASLLKDIHALYNAGEITNKGVYNSFVKKVEQAQKLAAINKNAEAKTVLYGFLIQLKGRMGLHVSSKAFDILKPQIESLISSL